MAGLSTPPAIRTFNVDYDDDVDIDAFWSPVDSIYTEQTTPPSAFSSSTSSSSSASRLAPQPYSHQRTHSLPPPQHDLTRFGDYLPTNTTHYSARSLSPAVRGSTSQYRQRDPPPTNRHSRNLSLTSDPSVLARHGFPTYRSAPGAARPPTAWSHLTPISLSSAVTPPAPLRRSASPLRQSTTTTTTTTPLRQSTTPPPSLHDPTTTLRQYLTLPSPLPTLLHPSPAPPAHSQPHMWFDIRALRPWTDFTPSALTSVPGIHKLLHIAIPARSLPIPSPPPTTHLHSTPQLAWLFAHHHGTILNAALAASLGPDNNPLRMHWTRSSTAPDFLSSHAPSSPPNVIGLIRPAAHLVPQTIPFLAALATLHHHLRLHNTRYGFLASETHILCIRAGPLFGHLDLSAPIPLSAQHSHPHPLALYHLHMLAKTPPLPGHPPHTLVPTPDPSDRLRAVPARDPWMPRVTAHEERTARRVRGWAWPDEKLSRKEKTAARGGKAKRRAR